MKSLVIIPVTLFVIFLVWTSLHDIIRSNEPDYSAEYSALILSVSWFIFLIYVWFKPKIKKLKFDRQGQK